MTDSLTDSTAQAGSMEAGQPARLFNAGCGYTFNRPALRLLGCSLRNKTALANESCEIGPGAPHALNAYHICVACMCSLQIAYHALHSPLACTRGRTSLS